MNRNLQKTLVFLRKSNNYSQKEFAKKVNMSHSTYNRIETGTRNITIDDLRIFLEVLNIDYFDFFSCLIELELESTLTTTHYQSLLKEAKKLTPDKEKMTKSFDYFKNKINNANENDIPVNTILTSYIQLSFLFPDKLEQINNNQLNQIGKTILQKKYWTSTDYFVIAIIIPNLNASNVDTISQKILNIEPIDYAKNKHKYIHSLIQNLVDYYLVNYSFYDNNKNKIHLNNLFSYWKNCLSIFNDMEADLIYKHMYDMYSLLFSLEDKETIYLRCQKRIKGLEYLEILTLKNAMETETQDYYNQNFGNLKCVITDTSNNINQNLYLDK